MGSPPQEVSVFPATAVQSIWTIAPPLGCSSGNASNCTVARGGLFNSNHSSTWEPKATYLLGAESNLGYTTNSDVGVFGFDTLGIGKVGAGNATLDHQVVGGIFTTDFYVGSLGLSPQTINFTDNVDQSPSFLGNLKEQNLIPSIAYGYTAGASYSKSASGLYHIRLTMS